MSDRNYYWTEAPNGEYQILFRPDETEVTTITEPEDRNFFRDLAPVCAELNDLQDEITRLRERIRLLEDEPCPDCNGDGHWGKEPDGRYRSCETCGGHEDRLGSGKLRAPMLEEIARLREQRDKAEATLEMVKALADGYDWLSDGRGPYAYDDGCYDDDVRQFVGQLLELLPSGNWLGMREWEAKYRSTEAENAWLREQAEALADALEELQATVQAACEGGQVDIPGLEILGEALDEADAALAAYRAQEAGPIIAQCLLCGRAIREGVRCSSCVEHAQ